MKTNSITRVIKNNLFIIIIFLLMQFWESCTTQNIINRDCYDVKSIDSTLFNEYLFITIAKNNKSKMYLISKKDYSQSFSKGEYELIKFNNNYCFEVSIIDTTIKASLYGNISQNNPDIYIDDVLIWSNGKIVCKIYRSTDIKDKYILKMN